MKNYKHAGEILNHTAAANIVSGQPVLIGAKLGVAVADIASGASGALAVDGVFELAKLSTDVVAQGALLYWDATNSRLTTTATANTLVGYAASAASGSVALVEIKLNN